jgi:hypothetical protein
MERSTPNRITLYTEYKLLNYNWVNATSFYEVDVKKLQLA